MPDHDTLVWVSKTFGLFYLMALFSIAVLYAFWPSKGKEFETASATILTDEDKPWRT